MILSTSRTPLVNWWFGAWWWMERSGYVTPRWWIPRIPKHQAPIDKPTVDGRNQFYGDCVRSHEPYWTNIKSPSVACTYNPFILLMVQKYGVHQLRLAVYLNIHRVLYIPGGARFLPSTVSLRSLNLTVSPKNIQTISMISPQNKMQ